MAEPSVLGSVGKYAAMGATVGSAFPGLGTAIGAAAGAIIGGVAGFIQKRKAKKALEAAKFNAVPKDVLETQAMARQMAKEGMPSEQYKMAERNIQRNQNAAMQAAQDRRGGLMKVGQVQQATNDATLALDAESARQKRANIQYLGQVNNVVGAYRQKRGERDWDYAMGLLGAANQNLSNAADQGASALGYAINNMNFGGRSDGGYSRVQGLQNVGGGYGGNFSDRQTPGAGLWAPRSVKVK